MSMREWQKVQALPWDELGKQAIVNTVRVKVFVGPSPSQRKTAGKPARARQTHYLRRDSRHEIRGSEQYDSLLDQMENIP